ncbi:FAD-dependent oxidoreductase [Steroidobacter flavus]|uniref:FAD-dependent oxidoreductase n=1 Tax=Steroidobacter flavus TaxID=1842136 RepID=A0ABV8SW98_9GAMM
MSKPASDATCEVAIVGAGPAGLAAAALLREHGVDVTVVDEQARAGGLYGSVQVALHAVSERQDIDWRFQSTVLGIMRPSAYRVPRADAFSSHGEKHVAGSEQRRRGIGCVGSEQRRRGVGCVGSEQSGGGAHELWIQGPAGAYLLRARAVLLAPGCYDRPLAFPGWTLPGVMGAGAIQGLTTNGWVRPNAMDGDGEGFLQSEPLVSGNRFLLAGSHPLQLVVADRLLSAGARVAAVVFTQRKQQAWLMMRHPLVAFRHRRQLLEISHILGRLRRAGVPVIFGHTVVRADGTEAVERATVAAIDTNGAIDSHKTAVVECDRIGICHGFLTSSELARQAGAEMHWKDHAGGWLACHDEWLESSIEDLFVAGEITGVDGADAALEKGRIAAVGILRALGRVDDHRAHNLAASARKRLSRLQRFSAILQELARPPAGLQLQTMSDDTIVCPCESIKRGELRRALADNKHTLSADGVKSLTRVGMGLCQGRMCGDNVARVIAEARGVQPNDVGPFQAQAPVKPVPLAAFMSRP